jgi:ABC-type phosphate/phosphonate transport system substrate-binding protein
MARYISSFRMYNATLRIAGAWKRLFAQVFDELELDIAIIDHGWPDPIESLWARTDLCCGFMCGWPFARSAGAVQAIAAPVPSLSVYAGLARYRSEFLVRRDEEAASLEAMFGRRMGWMTENSQSGFNAPRRALSDFARTGARRLFAQSVGPLHTPARTIAALSDGLIDLAAVDCFYLDLLRHSRPEVLDGVRTLAVTPFTAMPLLVAGATIPPDVVERLKDKLVLLHSDKGYQHLLADVLLSRFVKPDLAGYEMLDAMAQEAVAAGYSSLV